METILNARLVLKLLTNWVSKQTNMSDVSLMKDKKHNHIERKHVRMVLVWSVAPSLNLKNLLFFSSNCTICKNTCNQRKNLKNHVCFSHTMGLGWGCSLKAYKN